MSTHRFFGNGQRLFTRMAAKDFDIFIKFISIKHFKSHVIVQNSEVLQLIDNWSAIAIADLKKYLGTNVNMAIDKRTMDLKFLKRIRDNAKVEIYEGIDAFTVIYGKNEGIIPKSEVTIPPIQMPDLQKMDVVGFPLEFPDLGEIKNVIGNTEKVIV